MLEQRPLLERFLSEAAGGGFSRLKLTYQRKKTNKKTMQITHYHNVWISVVCI